MKGFKEYRAAALKALLCGKLGLMKVALNTAAHWSSVLQRWCTPSPLWQTQICPFLSVPIGFSLVCQGFSQGTFCPMSHVSSGDFMSQRCARIFARPSRHRRRCHGHVQHGQVHPRLCAQLLPDGPGQRLAAVPQHQEHHPQEVRRPLQGHLPRHLQVRQVAPLSFTLVSMHPVRRRQRCNDACLRRLSFQGIPSSVRGQRNLVRAPSDRRHGGPGHEVRRRLHLGLQELRRRRAVGLCGARLVERVGPDHLCALSRSGLVEIHLCELR